MVCQQMEHRMRRSRCEPWDGRRMIFATFTGFYIGGTCGFICTLYPGCTIAAEARADIKEGADRHCSTTSSTCAVLYIPNSMHQHAYCRAMIARWLCSICEQIGGRAWCPVVRSGSQPNLLYFRWCLPRRGCVASQRETLFGTSPSRIWRIGLRPERHRVRQRGGRLRPARLSLYHV